MRGARHQSKNVFNVFPKETIGERDYIFNATLDKFHVNCIGIKAVVAAISAELEKEYGNKFQVQIKGQWESVLIAANHGIAKNGNPGSIVPDMTSISLNLKNVTVREILNQVAIQENKTYYVMHFPENGVDCLIFIFIQTET